MSNPFDESGGHNPWSNPNEGPRFGNAYEDSTPVPAASASPALPPRKNSPFVAQRMPSPSDYSSPVNAWQESNKTLDEPDRNAWSTSPAPQPANAYQYSGTAYGNASNTGNAYSSAINNNDNNQAETAPASQKIETQMSVNDTAHVTSPSGRPSKIRVLLRVILFIAAVGHLGFAAGASPYSKQPVPFDSTACFYFLFAVAILSIIYSGFHVFLYMFRRFGSAQKLKRPILILCDLFMALMWGIGIIVEIAKYKCPPGQYNHWCDFYNTSIFFGFASFALYIVVLGWDVYGGMCAGKRK